MEAAPASGSTIADCRSCGGQALQPVLSLGNLPLANAFLRGEDLAHPEPRYPLDVVFCPGCSLVQITETVPPEELFGQYVYFSSYSDTMLRHAEGLAELVSVEKRLDDKSHVVEVASNDGYLLQFYRRRGVPVLGIEPARNVAREANERGIPTVCDFFGLELARRLAAEGRRADVLHAHNVLAHVADLNGFVGGLAELLKDDGTLVVEVPYVKDLLDRCEFDTIYHEHLCYFSVTALEALFRRHGLALHRVEHVPIHGGSLRLFAGRGHEAPDSVGRMLADERAWVGSAAFYAEFEGRVRAHIDQLRSLLTDLRRQGRRLAAYGAAAKGTVLLNVLGSASAAIAFVADRNPHKQGRWMPGVRLPIRSPEALLEERPEYVLLLAWNLMKEVLDEQQEYRRGGGRFIVPIPEVRIV